MIAETERVAMMSKDYRGSKATEEIEDSNNRAIVGIIEERGEVKTRQDCIRVHSFKKEYYKFCRAPVKAVNSVSFGLDYGECFALLGENGAGKSTVFKALTRDILPTAGDITIQGFNVQKRFGDARKIIGYCPQQDAIFPKLTVFETLKFFALVKGIRIDKVERIVEEAIKDLGLEEYRNKLAGKLSGGNRRRLSVAIALIGDPSVILLDEPSACMDPEARRFVWKVI